MAEFPALPLWTDAYLADTNHLTEAEHGRYLLLLMLIWKSPQCRVPNDDAWLAKRFRRSVEEFRADIRPIIDEFCTVDGNCITQKRLLKEYDFARDRRIKATDSANHRWRKEKDQCVSNASIPNLSKKERAKALLINGAEAPLLKLVPSVEGPESDWPRDYREAFWEAYPRRVGKAAALAKLDRVKAKGVPWAKIIAAIGRIDASEPKYIPHPTTWLNQGRWDDEPAPKQRPSWWT